MASRIYRFADFHLDPAGRELRRGGEEVALHRKAFDCIVYLIEHRDRAVEREELFEAAWGGVQLSDGVLGQAILEARRALDDTGEDQRVIKTVRAFGYRWVAPVEAVEPDARTEAVTDADAAGARRRPRSLTRWLLVVGAAVGVLAAGAFYLQRGSGPEAPERPPPPAAEGGLALLLPVQVEAGPEDAWVRLGVMDLIATRLRHAGHAMVPSDTVIALLRDPASPPGADAVERLAASTGAHLVLAAQAQSTGSRWTVSVHSRIGAEPPVIAVGEAYDVLAAARTAADRLAIALGLTPAPEPVDEPALQRLVQQIEAARLAQQMDVARRRIEEAPPRLRRHPEIRFQRARVDFYNHDLARAEAALVALRDEPRVSPDSVLRARVANLLGAVYGRRGDLRAAARSMVEAVRLFDEGRDTSALLGITRMNLGYVLLERGDVAAARRQLSQARRIFEGLGHVRGLAGVDNNRGVLEARRERYAEARRHFESAADRSAAVQDVGGELRARINMLEGSLWLLDIEAAMAVEPRVRELAERTSNPELVTRAKLSRSDLLHVVGRTTEARALLQDALAATDTADELRVPRMLALTRLAERAVRDGDGATAARIASEVLGQGIPAPGPAGIGDARGRAWLALVRARIAQGELAAAAAAADALVEWARRGDALSTRIHATLAEAEVAAAEGREEAAETAFERALTLADRHDVPWRLLRVVESYVTWLLRGSPHRAAEAEQALAVAGHLAGYVDRNYDAALLQLRAYHALGPPSAWRAALARATTLAGERTIPTELQDPPPPVELRY